MTVKGKAVVLGGYGLIGAACCRALLAAGYDVVGVGRSKEAGARTVPGVTWLASDLGRETDWARLVAGAQVVVNASGALQDGLRDDLEAIHVTAVERLLAVLEGTQTRLIQISAAGVGPDAPTEFFRSKARGDAKIMASAVDHVILRPVLVLGAQAYGGTALLRAVAAMPWIEPRVMAETPVATVALSDVAQAVVFAAEGNVPSGKIADLTEDQSRSFGETVRIMRRWLGFPAWGRALGLPSPVLRLVGYGADALGWLGWRSPLRSTALRQLDAGIVGDPGPWKDAGGFALKSLDDTLQDMPATLQDRQFGHSWALLPLSIGVLSLFWLLSGLIGVAQLAEAKAVLTLRGMADWMATIAVLAGSIGDIAVGLLVLVRSTARQAIAGMIALSLVYLGMGTLLTPDLWLDPLGPFVKVLPTMVLALAVLVWLDDR